MGALPVSKPTTSKLWRNDTSNANKWKLLGHWIHTVHQLHILPWCNFDTMSSVLCPHPLIPDLLSTYLMVSFILGWKLTSSQCLFLLSSPLSYGLVSRITGQLLSSRSLVIVTLVKCSRLSRLNWLLAALYIYILYYLLTYLMLNKCRNFQNST